MKQENYLKKELYNLIKKDEIIFDWLQESSLDGLWYWDLENPENEWMNSSFWTTLGYDPDEMPHKSNAWQTIINQDDLNVALENFNKHVEDSNHPYDQIVRYTHKNGSIVWVRCRGMVIRDDKGKVVRMLGAHHNVTELKEMEEKLIYQNEKLDKKIEQRTIELKKQNDEYAALNEEYKTQNDELKKAKEEALLLSQINKNISLCSNDWIWEVDLTGKFTHASGKAEDMLGYRSDEIIGKTIFELTDPDEVQKIGMAFQKLVSEKAGPINLENLNIHKNGKKVWNIVNGIPFFDDTGSLLGYRGANKDITAQKEAELKLLNQNKELLIAKQKAEESDQLKTEFINNMSHEIRTPMNGILGFSKFLNKENLNSEKRKHYIKIIQNSGIQLMKIIDDILEISKLGTKQVKLSEKEVCLNNLLLEHFSIFDIKAKENKTPLYLKKGLSDKESMILTDEIKLNKILSNLIENALKFTNTGFIEFGYKQMNTELEIYVKDTGIGIRHEKQASIFKRFSQEEKELSKNVGGLGLGLSIAKENAELIGGKITLISEKEKGSTFYVTIPYKQVNLKTENDYSSTDKTDTQDKRTILIVEDEEVNYLYLEALLEELEISFKFLHAKDGKEAVEICKKNSEIDIVLMDLKMPIMNGFEATKQIKELRPDIQVVAQTAYTTNEDRARAYSAGCDDFISKPLNEEDLNTIINKYLTIS